MLQSTGLSANGGLRFQTNTKAWFSNTKAENNTQHSTRKEKRTMKDININKTSIWIDVQQYLTMQPWLFSTIQTNDIPVIKREDEDHRSWKRT